MDAVRKLAGILMQKGPVALRLSMEAIHGGFDMSLEEALNWEANLFGVCSSTEDTNEGLVAFLEKRKPDFKGR
jgi:enoyl-CoA hydratase